MPMAAYRPLTMSAIEVPTRTRRPRCAAPPCAGSAAASSGAVPVIDIRPDSAWMIRS